MANERPVRYAEWTPSPYVQPARRFDLREWWKEFPSERKKAVLVALALVPITFLIYMPATILAIGVLRFVCRPPLETKPTDLSGIAPVPLPEGHVGVSVELKLAGVVYGKDVGVLTFVDGWMVFEGRQCRFSIAASDVDWRPPTTPSALRLLNGQEVRLLPLDGWLNADESVHADDRQLGRMVYQWQRRQDQPEGDSLYPPLQADPELDPATTLRQMIRLLVLTPIVVGLVAALGVGTDAFSFILVIGAIIFLLCLWFTWQKDIERKRLAQALKEIQAR